MTTQFSEYDEIVWAYCTGQYSFEEMVYQLHIRGLA